MPARASWLLWLGAATGLALAVTSISGGASSAKSPPAAQPTAPAPLPRGAVAVVDGVLILQADYDLELRRIVERERRAPTARDKQAAVQRLVDDELLLARGIELGMVRADAPTRRALLGAVFASERAAAVTRAPSAEEIERAYREAGDALQQPGKLRLRQLSYRVLNRDTSAATHARAADAVRRLRAGEPFEQVRVATAAYAGPDPLSDRLVSVAELREQLGPVALAAALALQPGQVSEVLGSGPQLRVLLLLERGEPELPPLQEIRAQVQRMAQQQAADRAFAARIAELRKDASIRVAERLP